MRDFAYVAHDIMGRHQNGFSRAASKNDVIVWLRGQGLMPIDVHPVDSSKTQGTKIFKRQKVKPLEMASFCWQLHAMIEGGVSITSGLATIADDCENQYFHDIILQVGKSIERGDTFSDSLAKFPKVFNQLFCSMIMAGETGGALPAAMKRLAEYYDTKDKLGRKVKGAIAYPAFVVVFIVFLVVFIMTFIIPRFKSLFDNIGGELPLITKALMSFYDIMMSNAIAVFCFISVAVFGVILYGRTERGKVVYSKLALKIPLIGKIISQAFIVMFCRTLSTLLAAGVSVLDALEIISKMSSNMIIRSAIVYARANIVEGSSISMSMSACKFFPRLLVKMIQVGEETGSLPNILDRTSNYYERKVETIIATVMAVLEPVLIVAVGLIVLLIVLALYLPIFSLSDIK